MNSSTLPSTDCSEVKIKEKTTESTESDVISKQGKNTIRQYDLSDSSDWAKFFVDLTSAHAKNRRLIDHRYICELQLKGIEKNFNTAVKNQGAELQSKILTLEEKSMTSLEEQLEIIAAKAKEVQGNQ